MCRPSKPLASRKSMGRSAVTNGKVLHSNASPIDGRGHNARRFRDLVAAFSEGFGDVTEADKALIKTAATLALKMELLQADLVAGKEVDADQLIRLAGTSKRALAAVSAKAVDRKPAGQTLAEYMAAKARAAEQSDDGED
jgi:hypothetical protein